MKPPATSLPFFFCLLLTSASSAQLHSLLSLKLSLSDPLDALRDWDDHAAASGDGTPAWCSWSGVRCGRGTGDVVSLDLSNRNLSGSIASIDAFSSSLVHLNLSWNAFSGPFPATIFSLDRLKTLDVNHNNFDSVFPPGASKLVSLKSFDAYSNSFTGPLPEDFAKLPLLEKLNLSGSYFEGAIPDSFGSFLRLKHLGLAGNLLEGEIPAALGGSTELERLEVGYNQLTGPLPAELGKLWKLRYLDMSKNDLSGHLPPQLGNLTMLHTLLLFKNQFSGEIPASISTMRTLRVLDLSDNHLSGAIPEGIAWLSRLSMLSLMSNRLSGEVPEAIGELPELDTLLLWNNSLTGSLPATLGSNGKLVKLDVSTNRLTGPIPPALCSGNKLMKLILFSNKFNSNVPAAIANCSSLLRLRLQDNELNGSIPYGFGLLPNLTFMDLSKNRFSGHIPRDLGNAVKLEYLNVSENAFETPLPDNIWNAPNLQEISASSSKLVGKIPEFKGCRSLYKIELDGNSLNGSIPWDIEHCTKLLSLNLRENSLTGIIPWEISTLPSITDIDLSHNQLSGTIPSSFEKCTTLESFNVSFNKLNGAVPAGAVFANLHPSSFVGNNGLCGGVANPCSSAADDDGSNSQAQKQPRKSAGAIVWIMAGVFGAGLLILIAGSRCFHHHRHQLVSRAELGPLKLTAFQRLNFTADDVLECLASSDKIIGMGGAGTVYRAEMPGGEAIAVKKLWGKNKDALRRRRGALAEVEVLGNVRHRNIVRLLGCCSNKETTMLLYEYMPNGSLDDLLHGKVKGVADWLTRYKIAVGVAQGICYLHHDCDPVIVHRDLKPSNILLDGEMEARVADFGVAKLIMSDESMSVIAGSYGYIAPEYAYTLQVDEKSDIYSYGVVLMEILSGRRSVEAEFGEGNSIVDWVRAKMKSGGKEGVEQVLDKNAGAGCGPVREEMLLLLRVALLCTSRNPADRPSMRDVVSMLQEAKPKRKLADGKVDIPVPEKPCC
uniref:non-specific serine/threonine protein kinase n=1 Tax=Kalanchoe fedtschenkoi TaxID=63787 RepID=A0A7N1A4G8_KALFE